jgi:hypothetical protein
MITFVLGNDSVRIQDGPIRENLTSRAISTHYMPRLRPLHPFLPHR